MPKKTDDHTYDVKNGEWLDVGKYTLHECCDCSLIHRVRYRLHEGKVQESWRRDDRATARARRAAKRKKANE